MYAAPWLPSSTATCAECKAPSRSPVYWSDLAKSVVAVLTPGLHQPKGGGFLPFAASDYDLSTLVVMPSYVYDEAVRGGGTIALRFSSALGIHETLTFPCKLINSMNRTASYSCAMVSISLRDIPDTKKVQSIRKCGIITCYEVAKPIHVHTGSKLTLIWDASGGSGCTVGTPCTVTEVSYNDVGYSLPDDEKRLGGLLVDDAGGIVGMHFVSHATNGKCRTFFSIISDMWAEFGRLDYIGETRILGDGGPISIEVFSESHNKIMSYGCSAACVFGGRVLGIQSEPVGEAKIKARHDLVLQSTVRANYDLLAGPLVAALASRRWNFIGTVWPFELVSPTDLCPPALVKATLDAGHAPPRDKLLQFCCSADLGAASDNNLKLAAETANKPGESLLLVGLAVDEPIVNSLEYAKSGSLVWINDVPPPLRLAGKVAKWVATPIPNTALCMLLTESAKLAPK